MDQHITAVIVNRKENKLKKGSGYHLDLLIVSITIGINSLFGIPWFVAATVLSLNHVISLKKESESAAPGEKPKFLGVIEQRVTSLIVFILIGSSVFLSKVLNKIPMPVLYGVFLYMGISSLNGIQFMHRLTLIFMPEKHQPDFIFLRHVRTIKVHLFTFIQISCLAMLFIIKSNKRISILFPIMVLALVGVRKLMDYIFTQKELSYLDDIMPEITKRSKEDCKNHESNDSETKSENTQVMNKI
jgi:sodium bicarbonate transporter 10